MGKMITSEEKVARGQELWGMGNEIKRVDGKRDREKIQTAAAIGYDGLTFIAVIWIS